MQLHVNGEAGWIQLARDIANYVCAHVASYADVDLACVEKFAGGP